MLSRCARAAAFLARSRTVSRGIGIHGRALAGVAGAAVDERRREPSSYPSSFVPTTRVSAFVRDFAGLPDKAREKHIEVRLAGRIIAKRDASSKLVFFDVVSDGEVLQVMASRAQYGSGTESAEDAAAFAAATAALHRGDIVGIRGFPAKSGRGELSIMPRELTLLAPCLHNLPERGTLKDPELRFRQRYLDLMVNEASAASIFLTRTKVIRTIRTFLERQDFLEVETPTLSLSAGGASARPFETEAWALGLPLRLRIAPELFLKQCVIGGFERVFEIGKVFRNEGIDATHHPEFTSIEFYQAYANVESLMTTTEDLLREVVTAVKGVPEVELPAGFMGQAEPVTLRFDGPFRRLSIPSELAKRMGEPLPDANDPASAGAFEALLRRHGLDCPAPRTPARMLDRLIGHFLEPECVQPTFLCDHPCVLSPLAKNRDDDPGLTQRFELFVAGKELCNAYGELNDPAEQRRRFQQQEAMREGDGDAEAQRMDHEFCRALEYGLPPTGGWGMGIDRLVMLLTGQTQIREVLLFPIMRPLGGEKGEKGEEATKEEGEGEGGEGAKRVRGEAKGARRSAVERHREDDR